MCRALLNFDTILYSVYFSVCTVLYVNVLVQYNMYSYRAKFNFYAKVRGDLVRRMGPYVV